MILNKNEIKKLIPHREPFLLVDEVVSMTKTEVQAYKHVLSDEYYFQGHFPNHPIMPGVLIVESLAQAGAILLLSQEAFQGKIAYLVGVEGFRFKHPVYPGDILELNVCLIKQKESVGIASAKACVGEKVVAHGTIKFAVDQ